MIPDDLDTSDTSETSTDLLRTCKNNFEYRNRVPLSIVTDKVYTRTAAAQLAIAQAARHKFSSSAFAKKSGLVKFGFETVKEAKGDDKENLVDQKHVFMPIAAQIMVKCSKQALNRSLRPSSRQQQRELLLSPKVSRPFSGRRQLPAMGTLTGLSASSGSRA